MQAEEGFVVIVIFERWRPALQPANPYGLGRKLLLAGIGLDSRAAPDVQARKHADRKRQAFLRYLDDIDEAVHARRLDGGETGLIGVAEYMFTVRPDGTFTDPVLRASSGSPQLDASARRAVLAASGKVRRPAIIGTEPIPVILHVKYQYGLR